MITSLLLLHPGDFASAPIAGTIKSMECSRSHRDAKEIFFEAVKSVDPYEAVKLYGDRILSAYERTGCSRTLLIGFGKAACPMAKAVEEIVPDLMHKGMVITKYGHCPPSYYTGACSVIEAGHPLPDENGLRGTAEMVKLLKNADEKTLIICLISGGGSALLASPAEGITLAEKQKVTELLLTGGADIFELNTVRKHLSKVKGGRLAGIAYPAWIVSLILSDVIGDRLDVIASGPTSPDNTTFRDALEVLGKYSLSEKIPGNVLTFLDKGARGMIPETPKTGDRVFERVENIIVGSNAIALSEARRKAEEMGFHADILPFAITGEAREAGRILAGKAIPLKKRTGISPGTPLCLISGGETTVTVKGSGLGGRNMELALSFAREIDGMNGITLLSAGTDGTDGPTDAAGAIVDGGTIRDAKKLGLDSDEYLKNNDSYHFFKKLGTLFITAPTGTNVMDIQILLIA
jgi:glycerate 2-kinase